MKHFSNNQPEISNPIRQRILKCLTDNDWNVQQGEYSLNVRVRCDNAIYPLYIFVSEEGCMIQVYSYLDANIPEHKRSAVSEYFTRANSGMNVGNFEFDMDSGEIKYKTYLCLGNNLEFLTDDIIENLIGLNYSSMDKYYPGIMRILYSNDADIKKIIEDIENPVQA